MYFYSIAILSAGLGVQGGVALPVRLPYIMLHATT